MNTNCLLLHGLAQNNTSLDPIRKVLENNNLSCFSPQLPGHRNTLPRENEVNYHNWDLELQSLLKYISRDFNDKVLIVGHSFGSLLALRLAQEFPNSVLGLILISPSLKLRKPMFDRFISGLRYVPDIIVKNIPSIKKSLISRAHAQSNDHYCFNILKHLGLLRHEVLKNISKIECPIFMIQNIKDYHLSPVSSLQVKEQYKKNTIKLVAKDYGDNHNLAHIPEIENLISDGIHYIYETAEQCLEK